VDLLVSVLMALLLLLPQVAKGARDFLPEQMSIREQAFAKISAVSV
jgi:hypothetical protein